MRYKRIFSRILLNWQFSVFFKLILYVMIMSGIKILYLSNLYKSKSR